MKFSNIKFGFWYKLKYIVVLFFIVLFTIIFFIPNIQNLPQSTIIYDKKGIEIGEIPFQDKYRHREFSYQEIPSFYLRSIVSIEDKSFHYNLGISVSGLFRSVFNNIKAGKTVEGGSTISSQLIRNSFWLNEKRTFSKKILEFIYSVGLNIKYSKSEILRIYADRLYFGYLNYGIKSASKYYFDKELNNLTKAELIALITIQKNASKYDPYKFRTNFDYRFIIVAKALKNNGIMNDREYEDVINEKLNFNASHKNKLPYISDFIENVSNKKILFIDSSNKLQLQKDIKLTIDYDLSKKIEEISTNAIMDLAWKNVKDYGVIILDKKTNNLSVMIGGKNYSSIDGQVNSVLSLRQPGSTIKAFTYLLASKELGFKPNDTILDLPVLYKTKDDYSYEPKNYSTKFEGEVTLGEALAQSMNVPAVRLLEKLGVDKLLDFLHILGIKSLNKDADYYGLALTLGDGEVSLYELTRAYSIFANEGNYCDINFIKGLKSQCHNIINKENILDINYILSNRYLKIGGYPINSTLDFTDINVFFKTGTSRNFRDNWTIGFTDNYLIGVWAGNKDASNMKGVSGATGAGEIFGRIVRYLEKPNKGAPKIDTTKNTKPYLQITTPLDGQRYQIDKYISVDKQKVKLEFSTNISYDKYFWFLDNSKVSDNFIDLKIGKHNLNLELMKDGEIVNRDSIDFEVVGEE